MSIKEGGDIEGNLNDSESKINRYSEGQVLLISDKSKDDIIYRGNAVQEAVEGGYVQEISKGQWIYLQEAAKIVKAFQDLLRQHIAKEQGFEEWIFPRLQRRESIANFGWEAHENLRKELMRVVPNVLESGEHLPELYLDPLQCPSFYRYLSLNGPLPVADTPRKVYEVLGGWTCRNEKPERLKSGFQTGLEFIGAEMVFLGKPEDVSKIRMETLSNMISMLDKLGIVWRLVVGGSCCHSDSKKYSDILGEECRMDQIPTMDIECYIPYTDEWVELGGGDLAYDRLTSNFGITFKDSDEEVWSGCQGMGFGRSMYIFLSQFGFDQNKWPKELTDKF
jgi:seryl-tRNA synthetase